MKTYKLLASPLNTTTVRAISCPPKHNNKYDDYDRFFKTLGNRIIAGGDYNVKTPSGDPDARLQK
jgi:hypothetical protein